MSYIDTLFRQALRHSEEDRGMFLEGLNEDERRQVEARLAAASQESASSHPRQPLAAEGVEPMKTPKPIPSTTPLTAEQLQVDRVGPYKILQQIGEGGMGEVYMADQSQPVRRRVALKVIKTDTPSKEILARFEAERQALAMMDHQNIAKVLDAGITEDGRPYFAMELVRGVSITEYCDKNKLTPNERLELFMQTCRAIQHAHMKGIVHRDIKPSNVLVTLYDGKPVAKVIDFGLAKALQDTNKLTDRTLFTQYGQVVGTLAYMSPEQAEMNALDVDTRTDVYSLGVILYELLTGSTPITREKIRSEAFDRILALIREEETTRPSQRLSESGEAITGISEQRKTEPRRLSLLLRGDLDWIAIKALEKDRIRRYETPAALADDVQRYLDDETVVARPPTFGYQLRKAVRKYRVRFSVALTILGLLITGLVVVGLLWIRSSAAELDAKAQRDRANEKEELAKIEARNAVLARNDANDLAQRFERAAAASKLRLANARWELGRTAEARELLHEIPDDYRDSFEWRYSRRRFLGSDLTLYGHQNSVNSVAFTPDGAAIASGGADQTIRLWDAVSGDLLKTITGHATRVQSVAFSPDGRRIASAGFDKEIRVWDVVTGSRISTYTGHSDIVWSVAFSPDGERIASCSSDKTIRIWEADQQIPARTLEHSTAVRSVAFSPDGRWIGSGLDDGRVQVWEVSTGEQIAAFEGHSSFVTSVVFSPNGRQLASGSHDRTVKLWEPANGLSTTLKGATDWVTGLAFSPDGACLAAATRDARIRVWDLSTGAGVSTLYGHSGTVTSLAFSPDGARIASGSIDNTTKIWSMPSASGVKTPFRHDGMVRSVSFDPDGKRVVSGGRDETIRLWDAYTGEQVAQLEGHTGSVTGVAFSPDYRWIASCSSDKTIKLWGASSKTERKTLTGHGESVISVAFSPDGKYLASGSEDETVRLWDVASERDPKVLMGHTGGVWSVAFSPDGKWIASAGVDKKIKIWKASTGAELTTLEGHTGMVYTVAFSPDGSRIVSGSVDNTLRLWDAISGTEVAVFTGHSDIVWSAAFSPDGRRIASASLDKTVRLWDSETGEEVATLQGLANSVAFSPHGERLASGNRDGTIRFWEAPAESEVRGLRGHTKEVWSVASSHDGRRIASGSRDATVKIWNAVTGAEISTMKGHDSEVVSVVFSPDGKQVVSGSWDRTIKIWDAATGDEFRTLRGHKDLVRNVAFNQNGTRICSESLQEKIVWDWRTGEQDATADWNDQAIVNHLSPDGRWLVVPSERFVLIVDQHYKHTPQQTVYRKARAKLRPWRHRGEAEKASERKDWFAAAFHAAWCLKLSPSSQEAHELLGAAWNHLSAESRKLLPAIVKEAMALPQSGS